MMSRYLAVMFAFGLNLTPCVWSQSQPLYRVTVVERTLKAVNYQYRNGPTAIDFRGTVLLPDAKGQADIESKAGRTDIDAKFSRLPEPDKFGGEYLTYVLWAITPEGHPKNLGEIIPGSSDKAKTHVTTDLQAFGMIVTAEPYAAVRQPSDVVVLENEIRPDTIGTIEPINVRYELMPRHGYVYDKHAAADALNNQQPKVSMSEYETTLELYQAQNAVQIAQASNAAQYASDLLSKAQTQLQNARQLRDRKADKSLVIAAAREAAQTAEDARLIADQRAKDADIAKARSDAERERQLRVAAENQAQDARNAADRAKADAQAAQMQAEQARADASADRMQLEDMRQNPPVVSRAQTLPPAPAATTPAMSENRAAAELRTSLMPRLNAYFPSLDTPRGLVSNVPISEFHGPVLDGAALGRLAEVAALINSHPGLRVEVDGNSDGASPEAERLSAARAEAVREGLIRGGLSSGLITVRSMGNSRPVGPNTSAQARDANCRTEIVISGADIGNTATWDRTYSIGPRK